MATADSKVTVEVGLRVEPHNQCAAATPSGGDRQLEADAGYRQTAVDVVSVLELGTAALSMTTRRNLGLLCGRVERMADECIRRGSQLQASSQCCDILRSEVVRMRALIDEQNELSDLLSTKVEKLQSQVRTLRAKARMRVVPSAN